MSLYLFLGLLAIIFSAFGFLTHAFYFTRVGEPRLAGREVDPHGSIGTEQNASREAQRDVLRLGAAVRSLEQDLNVKSQEMETLKSLASRQDEEIRQLQREAAQIRNAVAASGIGERAAVAKAATAGSGFAGRIEARTPNREVAIGQTNPDPDAARNESASAEIRGEAEAVDESVGALPEEEARVSSELSAQTDGPGTASWKENLNNILNILDALEKEVQK